ncbi:MAG: hypothetical protein ACHQU8_05135, partial [Gemmatimonadales bacterium]
MDDRRRYLKQLLEMGETELVLDGGGRAGERESRRVPSGQTPGPGAATSAVSPTLAPAHPPAASKVGPAMYPAGLTIESPAQSSDLFTKDPVAGSADLAALARLIDECRKCSLGHSRTHS